MDSSYRRMRLMHHATQPKDANEGYLQGYKAQQPFPETYEEVSSAAYTRRKNNCGLAFRKDAIEANNRNLR